MGGERKVRLSIRPLTWNNDEFTGSASSGTGVLVCPRRLSVNRHASVVQRRYAFAAMPLYEYRCKSCGQKFSELSGVVADSQPPACSKCGSRELEKLVSGFRAGRDETQRVESAADALERTDPDDAKAVGDAVADVGRAMDDDVSSEMSEMFEQDNE